MSGERPIPFSVMVTEGDAGAVVVAPAGELDLSSAGRLEAAIPAIHRGGRLVLDLRALEFMDSTGVRVLMSLDVRSRAEGWELVVACGPGPVGRVLDLCRLGERVRIVADPAG